jgi:hypothetical protein
MGFRSPFLLKSEISNLSLVISAGFTGTTLTGTFMSFPPSCVLHSGIPKVLTLCCHLVTSSLTAFLGAFIIAQK